MRVLIPIFGNIWIRRWDANAIRFVRQGEKKAARSQRDLISMFTKGGSVEFRHRTRDENEGETWTLDNTCVHVNVIEDVGEDTLNPI